MSKTAVELATRKQVVNDDGKLPTILAAPTEIQLAEVFGMPEGNELFKDIEAFLGGWNLKVDTNNLSGALLMAIKKGWPYVLCVALKKQGDETQYTWSLVRMSKTSDSGAAWQPSLLD